MRKKNLIVNSGICDARKMKEETYENYESIVLNTAILLVSESSKQVLEQLPVVQNSDIVLEMADDEDIETNVVNGAFDITPSVAVQENSLLVVNGCLRVEAGAEDVLRAYKKIVVNGSLKMPDSMKVFLDKFQVNGFTELYPDGYMMLGDTLTIDKFFILRAEQEGRYYVSDEAVISDESVNLKRLIEKRVQIAAPKLVLPESMVEDCAAIFDLHTEYVVVPKGMKLVYGDAELNDLLIREHGSSLFIYGDLLVDREADVKCLAEQIDRLEVYGTVSLTKAQVGDFMEIGAAYKSLNVMKGGRVLSDMARVKVDQTLLDHSPEGIQVCDVLRLVIDSRVKPEDILQKLTIRDCGSVQCGPEQESAVAAVSEDVGHIRGDKDFDLLGKMKDSKVVNASSCLL